MLIFPRLPLILLCVPPIACFPGWMPRDRARRFGKEADVGKDWWTQWGKERVRRAERVALTYTYHHV